MYKEEIPTAKQMDKLHHHLPHYDHPDLIQAITFRLYDSMPANLRYEWAYLIGINQPEVHLAKIQSYIDRGLGSCLLRNPLVAQIVEDCLLKYHLLRYRLLAWVIMPNHVHVLILPISGWSLATIVRDWKGYSTRLINAGTQHDGSIWHRNYFDRYIRDENHLERAVLYVHNNPVKAGLVTDPRAWPYSSARLVSEMDMTFCLPYVDNSLEDTDHIR